MFCVTVFAVACLVYVAYTGYQTTISPTGLSGVIDIIPFSGSGSDLVSVEENGGTSGDKQNKQRLFGEPAVIVVEGTDVDLKIPPGAGQGFTSQEEGESE